MVEIICRQCGESFLRQKLISSKGEPIRFCSRSCCYYGRIAGGKKLTHITNHSDESKRKIREARALQTVWNKGKKIGKPSWNTGLTKETSEIVCAIGVKVGQSLRGKKRGPLADATKKKIGDGRKGDKNWTKHPEVRDKISKSIKQLYIDRPEILENRKRCGKNQHSGTYSSLEKLISIELLAVGIPYIHNCRVGRYWADFLIYDRVIIECDGAYWHKDAEKERRRDRYLAEKYFVFHISESDILNNPGECVRKILQIYEPFAETEISGHRNAAGFQESPK